MFNNNFGWQMDQNNMCCPTVSKQNCPEDPVYESPTVNCIQKDYIHEVVHV